jgi:hypothetical protein
VYCGETEVHFLGDNWVGNAANFVPGFFKETMGQIKVFGVEYNLCKINHREIDSAA